MESQKKNNPSKKAKVKTKAKAKASSLLVSITKWTYWSIMMALTVLLCGILIISAFSDSISPSTWVYPSFLGIAFGFTLAFSVLWLIIILILRQWKCAIILIATLCIIYEPISRICPLQVFGRPKPEINEITKDGVTTTIPADSIRLFTYNTCAMGQTRLSKIKEKIRVIDAVRESGADIVCLQEYAFTLSKDGHTEKELRSQLSDLYPYYDFTLNTGKKAMGIALFSKFPIKKATRIDKRKSGYFSAMYYQLEAYGQRIGLINMHLHTNSIQPKDRVLYDEMIEHFEKDSLDRIRTGMMRSLARAFRSRSEEANLISRFLQETHPSDMPLIICGDMNDTPVSYCYRTLRHGLKDTWQEVGRGPGITFREHKFWFRIDHVFHSSHLKALDATVRKDILYSDHYPLQVTLQLLKNDQ